MCNTIDYQLEYWCSTCGKPIPEPTSAAESEYCDFCKNYWKGQMPRITALADVLKQTHKRTKKQEATKKRWQKRRNKCRQTKHKNQSETFSITWGV